MNGEELDAGRAESTDGCGTAIEPLTDGKADVPATDSEASVPAADGNAAAPATDVRADPSSDSSAATRLSDASLAELVAEQLRRLGEDPHRAGLLRTPERVAQSLGWLTRGYQMKIEDAIGDGVFEEEHDSMILVKDIELYSLCEHHMLPVFGKVHIAYIPDGRIVGLSKVPRVVEIFARRLQIQERLTEEIAGAIEEALTPRGVGVVVEAYHLCMMMRGVEKQNSKTITSAVRGLFRSDPRTREEFLRLVLSPQFIS